MESRNEMSRKKDLETELFHIGLVFLALGAVGWMLYRFLLRDMLPKMPCLFDTVLGIYCPGCGGTRAVEALLQGRVLLSLWYHPLIPYLAVISGGFMMTQGLDRLGILRGKGWKFHNWYLYGAIILVVSNFLIKNALRLIWNIRI